MAPQRLIRRTCTSAAVAVLALLCFVLACGAAADSTRSNGPSAFSSQTSGDDAFRNLVHEFIEADMRMHPVRATAQGDHRYDSRIDDMSRGGVATRILFATSWKRNFQALDASSLSPADEADREWLIAVLDSELLWSEQLRYWERSPGAYLPTEAVDLLIRRNFAPLSARMKSVTARELASLDNLEAAQNNLRAERTPSVAVEIVLAQMPAILNFFARDLPALFASVPSGPDKDAFRAANEKLIAKMRRYEKWLRREFMPRAAGNYAIGADAYRRMLADDDMVDVPLARLREVGETELARLKDDFRKTAHKIDPNHSPSEVAAKLNAIHPTAGQIIPTVAAGLDSLRSFVIEHHLATIPSDVRPLVRETPSFMRVTTFASMDTPGPLEKSSEAYFYVTLPDPSWPEKKREQLLEFFSPPLISDTSVHEVYPGHYVQFLNNRLNPDPVRALFYSGSNAEGWALYCEQMMLDEGLHGDAPQYRLAQLQMALLRACRYLVGIRMHTQGMTVGAAAAFFEKNAYMTPNNAMVEALRGTEDPGYLRYQLGKLMILKLREDMRKKQGAAFDLGKFHDAFLREGAVPIPLIRRAMTGAAGPLL